MLQNSCNQCNFCKILVKKYISCKIGEFESKSCKILATILHVSWILQEMHFFVRILQLSSFCIKSFLPCSEPTRNSWVLNRLLDSLFIYVEENTKLKKVSDTCSAITKTLWTWFVHTEYNSCKIFCKSGVFFAKILLDKHILQDFARVRQW